MRPIAWVICAWWVAASGADSVGVLPTEPAPIAVVKTLAELLAQPQMKVKDDRECEVRVRLGIESRSATAGSAILMYAVADNAAISLGTQDDLGPLVVRVQREGAEEHIDEVQVLQRQWPEAPLYLFLRSIPLPTSGRYQVKAFSPDRKRILAETSIDVAERPADEPCWLELVPDFTVAGRNADGIPWSGTFTVGGKALPKYVGQDAVPLLNADADGKVEGADKIVLPGLLPAQSAKDERTLSDAELPQRIAGLVLRLGNESYELRDAATRDLAGLGRLAEAALQKAFHEGPDPEVRNRAWYLLRALDGPFTVRLVNGALHLKLAVPFDPTSIDEHMLARWWVNGKPLAVKEPQDLLKNGNGQIIPTYQSALALNLSAFELKATDTVDVEFLYCPRGTERIVEDAMRAHQAVQEERCGEGDVLQPVRCLRSNRLKFAVKELTRDAR